MTDQAEPIGVEGVVIHRYDVTQWEDPDHRRVAAQVIVDLKSDMRSRAATRTPDPKAAGMEQEAITAMARAMCDRVNGQGDFDDNIAQRRKGWEAQAECALTALRAVDAAPGGGIREPRVFGDPDGDEMPTVAPAPNVQLVEALNVMTTAFGGYITTRGQKEALEIADATLAAIQAPAGEGVA
jgi:hypothetical protein